MTDAQILAIAYGFEQYPGAKEPTLRGQAIVDFARALMEWQPIETAPDNHIPILVHGPYGRMVAFRDVTWTWWPVPADNRLDYVPTHWMPLPSAPPEAQTHLPTVVDAAVDGAVGAQAYTPPGTTSSAAAPKEHAS